MAVGAFAEPKHHAVLPFERPVNDKAAWEVAPTGGASAAFFTAQEADACTPRKSLSKFDKKGFVRRRPCPPVLK